MSFIKAAVAVAVIAVAWVAIDLAWRRMFGRASNPRLSPCGGCTSCARPCRRDSSPGNQTNQEERHAAL